jgi:hypothetical protein
MFGRFISCLQCGRQLNAKQEAELAERTERLSQRGGMSRAA